MIGGSKPPERPNLGAFDDVADQLPDGLVITDIAGCVIWVNIPFCVLLARPWQELIGRPIEELLPPEELLSLVGVAAYLDGRDAIHDVHISFCNAEGKGTFVVGSLSRLRRVGEADRFALLAHAVGAREEALAETTRWAAAEQDRANEIERAREEQAQTLAELQETQSALLEASHRAALANHELKRKVAELERMELELRLAQKLEAVGRLAAGVAHEINTPIQFVSDSTHFAKASMLDIAGLLVLYRECRTKLGRGELLSAEYLEGLERAEIDADLDYLLENLPTALDRALDGIDRVAVIVRSMKEFAHLDEKYQAAIDLNHAVTSTLTIARNEYKYVADVETDFAAMPPVTCVGGEINQVLLNVIVNAAHAISDVVEKTAARGKISIKTREEDGFALIQVSDTGGGIPPHARDHLFDPFFTTKEVGKGTGQGLAIARSIIVEKHKGSISFDTELGKGTTFNIRIPIAGASQNGPESVGQRSSRRF